MKFPIISIIIPTLNSGDTLSQCLDSIVNQSYQNIEVLIIDGHSTDNTLEITRNYIAGRNFIYFFPEKDNGIYDAMNKGILLAKGEWLYFMGSDDRFYDENVLADIFESGLIKPERVIYGNVLVRGNAGWAEDGQIYDGEFSLQKLIEKNICHQAMFFRREVLVKLGGFNTRFNICSDWDMNFRLWAKYPFRYINRTVAVFNGGNSSSRNNNNYTDIDRWESIYESFRFRLFSTRFAQYYPSFLMLSNNYEEKRQYINALFMKLVYSVQKKRKTI